jgi:hypothetical protein
MTSFGGEASRYSEVSLAASLLVSAALGFVWRQRLVYGDGDSARVRRLLAIASVWATSLSALGLVAFSAYRSLLRPHPVFHEGYELGVALGGLVVSPIGLFGVMASGSRRWLLVLNSLILTGLWFLSVLDNINW